MQLLPGTSAGVFVAGFEDQHQCVETGEDFLEGSVGDGISVF